MLVMMPMINDNPISHPQWEILESMCVIFSVSIPCLQKIMTEFWKECLMHQEHGGFYPSVKEQGLLATKYLQSVLQNACPDEKTIISYRNKVRNLLMHNEYCPQVARPLG
jgi:hypothetical protein